MRGFLRGAALVVVAVSLAGCTAGEAVTTSVGVEPYEGGPITEAQYKAIVQYAANCMLEKGYEPSSVERRSDGVTYGFGLSGSAGGMETSREDLLACEAEVHLMEAEIAFQDQSALTGTERERVYAEFITCMEEVGVMGITSADDADAVMDKMALFVENGGSEPGSTACYQRFRNDLFGSR